MAGGEGEGLFVGDLGGLFVWEIWYWGCWGYRYTVYDGYGKMLGIYGIR